MAATPIPPTPPQAYIPYAGDYSTYGQGGEHLFFGNPQAPPPTTPTVPGVPGVPGTPGAPPPGAGEPPTGSSGGRGNEGGARGADNRASRAGNDRAAYAAAMGGNGSPLGSGTPVGPGTGAYASMPGWLDSVTSAAGALLPYPYGLPFTVGREAMRGYNMLGPTNENRAALGEGSLSGLQMLGGAFGTGYGNLTNPEISNAEEMQGKLPSGWDYGVTQYGGPMPGFQLGPFQIGGGEPTLGMEDAWEMHNMKVGDDEALAGTLQPWRQVSGGVGDLLSHDATTGHSGDPNAGSASGSGLAKGDPGRNAGTAGPGSKNEAPGMNSGLGGSNSGKGGSGSSSEAKGNAGGSGDNKGAGAGGQSGGADPGGASGGADPRGDHFARGGLADVRPMTLRRSRHPGKQRRALPGYAAPEPRRLLAAGAPNPPLPGGLGSVQQFDKGGFVRSRGAGRADSVNTKVPENTYIFPADYVAARGQGNSLHGAHVIDHLVRRVTARPQLAGGGRLPRPGKKTVPVALSGGEYRAPPHFVYAVGGGDYDRGSAILDHEVTNTRSRFAQHLQSLPPPKK